MAARPPPEVSRELSRQAWLLVRLQDMTQSQAAERLGVDQSTISRHLRAVEEEQAREFREEMELFRARQSLVFEHIAQQALAGWERSLQVGDRVGNPRFLAQARQAHAELRKLCPAPSSSASPPSTPSTRSGGLDYDEIIYHVNTLPGTYHEPERGNPSATSGPAGPAHSPLTTHSHLARLVSPGVVDLNLHPGQQRAWESEARVVLVLAGAQGGRTSFGPHWLRREMRLRGPGEYLVVTPTFPLLEKKALPEFRRLFERWLGVPTRAPTWWAAVAGRYTTSPVRQFRFSPDGERALFGRFDSRRGRCGGSIVEELPSSTPSTSSTSSTSDAPPPAAQHPPPSLAGRGAGG